MSEEITFHSWLKQRRKELSITQEELAETLGVSWITLRKLEAGDRRPSGQLAVLLADYLHIPTDEHQAFVAFARTGKLAAGDVSSSAPWRNILHHPTNLPYLLTSLIGRDHDVIAVRNHLLNPKTRLLTLTGAPGICKTRLALQSAQEMLSDFEDGAFFVDLSPVTAPEMVLQAIASTFGLKETVEQPFSRLMRDYFQEKQILLVLDNFEQVLDASTEVVKLMEASPFLKVLITSREALQVRGERRFFVSPLAMPNLEQLPDPEELVGYPSVELFVERAQAVAPDFNLSEDNAQDVAAVCAGLEGLPLAIELAASRANRLTPSDMRVALASRLKLLKSETRDLPLRQRTLRGAIDWSYSLLSSDEQQLFRNLGIFVNGFTPSAVASVCLSASETHEDAVASAVELLQSLLDKSLLRKEELKRDEKAVISAGSAGREARYGMLELIREYARDKRRERDLLAPGPDLERKHALYFMTLAEEASMNLKGPKQKEWLDTLEVERNNLSSALNWAWAKCRSQNKSSANLKISYAAEIGLRSAAALRNFWYIRGYFVEGREHLEQAIEYSSALEPSLEYPWSKTSDELQSVRADAFDGIATMLSELGDCASVNARRHDSLAIRRKINDKEGIGSSLNNLGIDAQDQGEYASARLFHEESLAVWREAGIKRGVVLALTNLGRAVFMQGENDLARSLHEESLAGAKEVGDKRVIALALTNLGFVLFRQEKYEEARSLYNEALPIQRDIGNKWGVAVLLTELGNVSLMLNDFDSARLFHEQSFAVSRETGHKWALVFTLHSMALLAFAQGEPESARALFQESLSLQRDTAEKLVIAANLAGLGGVAVIMQSGLEETLWGAKLLGAGNALRERMGAFWSPEDRAIYERGIIAARDQLGDEAFEQAVIEARTWSVAQALDYAFLYRRDP